MSYYGKIAVAKLNEKEEKENGVSYDLVKAIVEEGRKRGLTGSELNRWVAEKVRAFDNSKEEKENKMDVESIVKGLRKKELEKAGFDKKTIDYLSKNNTEDEKENGIDSHLRSLIGKKFKKDSDLERAVKQAISAKISDWNGSKMTVFDKQTDEKFILTTEDNNKYGAEQEFWISKVEKTNSKEEKNYYAKIVEQKHNEKKNFRDPLFSKVVGVGTPDDYKAKFKVGDKVKLKAGSGYSGEGTIVEGPIKMRASLTPTYRIKVTSGKEEGREVSRYEEELKRA